MRLAVLNPGGNDPEQTFLDHAGAPDDRVHAPVNYHAYAACTAGSFHRKVETIPADQRHVLLVLRRDLRACFTALGKLKSAGKIVAISIKESGLHQVAQLLGEARNLELFQQICALADGCLSSTPDVAPLYLAAGAKCAHFIPTPYPVDDARWDFSIPAAQRRGLFIGTREWEVPSRNHAAALLVATRMGEPVTVVNVDGRAGRKRLSALGCEQLRVIEGSMPYTRYLRLIAQHKLVFQLDRSAVPGQVAGDALLCRVPCVGGDSAIERIAFPDWNGHGRDTGEVAGIAAGLLRDDAGDEAVERMLRIAREFVSFPFVAAQLDAFYQRLEA